MGVINVHRDNTTSEHMSNQGICQVSTDYNWLLDACFRFSASASSRASHDYNTRRLHGHMARRRQAVHDDKNWKLSVFHHAPRNFVASSAWPFPCRTSRLFSSKISSGTCLGQDARCGNAKVACEMDGTNTLVVMRVLEGVSARSSNVSSAMP